MGRQVVYNQEARDALKRGVDILANAVKVTLGPKGRNVIIDKNDFDPVITKDGVTVAKYIYVNDPIENIGAQMVKKVAQATAEIAGDGTTTATVLAQAILTAGLKNVTSGANPMDLKKGIDKAVAAVVKSLEQQSIEVGNDGQKILQIATISANGDAKIGALIADAVSKVGKDGVITIEESKGTDTSVKIVEGMQFDKGFISPFFINTPAKMEVQFDNPYLLLVDKKINNIKELLPSLEKVLKAGRPLLVICDDLEGEALTATVINRTRMNLNVAAVKTPGYGNNTKVLLQDVAIATGATVISASAGYYLEQIELALLGQADRVIVDKNSTTILNGKGDLDKIKDRVDEIKQLITESDSDLDKHNLRERLAKLSAGVAVLYIGAATEVEMKEKKDRVDDALHATRAAIAEGIIPGGGIAYIRAIDSLKKLVGDNEDEKTGIQIIKRALEEPLRQICENAAVEASVIINKVKNGSKDFGYNARSGAYEPLIAAGVIDPTKVGRIALENAASIASMLLTTECVLADEPNQDQTSSNKNSKH